MVEIFPVLNRKAISQDELKEGGRHPHLAGMFCPLRHLAKYASQWKETREMSVHLGLGKCWKCRLKAQKFWKSEITEYIVE